MGYHLGGLGIHTVFDVMKDIEAEKEAPVKKIQAQYDVVKTKKVVATTPDTSRPLSWRPLSTFKPVVIPKSVTAIATLIREKAPTPTAEPSLRTMSEWLAYHLRNPKGAATLWLNKMGRTVPPWSTAPVNVLQTKPVLSLPPIKSTVPLVETKPVVTPTVSVVPSRPTVTQPITTIERPPVEIKPITITSEEPETKAKAAGFPPIAMVALLAIGLPMLFGRKRKSRRKH